jgi:beta-phosphoglucomutase-like phosphatase (HAD superfamily)
MKAVIFDMDGLMIDSERIIHEAVVWAGSQLGLENIENLSRQTMGSNAVRTKEIYFSIYGENCPFDRLMELKHKYLDRVLAGGGFPVKEGLYRILDFLDENGFVKAVASSTRKGAVYHELQQINVLNRFDVLICGDMIEKSKPDPEIFLKASSELGVNPEDCYVLEDSFNGVKAGYSAGMKTIMIPDMIMPDDEIIPFAWRIADNLDEAAEIIEKGMQGERL